jgi:hypothetical protein
MANIRQRKGQRYNARTHDVVVIETLSAQIFRGRLIDESPGGIGVALDGERPALKPNERIRVRCRSGNGLAKVRYVKEESPTSFRVGIKWDH